MARQQHRGCRRLPDAPHCTNHDSCSGVHPAASKQETVHGVDCHGEDIVLPSSNLASSVAAYRRLSCCQTLNDALRGEEPGGQVSSSHLELCAVQKLSLSQVHDVDGCQPVTVCRQYNQGKHRRCVVEQNAPKQRKLRLHPPPAV
jgi:hypothetical protein